MLKKIVILWGVLLISSCTLSACFHSSNKSDYDPVGEGKDNPAGNSDTDIADLKGVDKKGLKELVAKVGDNLIIDEQTLVTLSVDLSENSSPITQLQWTNSR